MGSQLVKQAFKDTKQASEIQAQPFNQESLADDCLVDLLFDKLFYAMSADRNPDWETVFPQSNIQSNPKSVDEQFMKKMLKQTVQEDSMAGFATSEHTIKLLQESSYSTYFRVFTDQDTIDFTRLQQKKFLVLYGLFLSKAEKQGASEQTFFQFVEKFLQENVSTENQRSIVGLNTGLRFSLSILKELYKIRSDILTSSLTHLYDTLSESPAGSVFSVDALGFQQDQTLNEARGFLISVIQDKESSKDLSEIAAKIIIRLGIVRSNPEDFLVLIETLNKNLKLADMLDLRDEIKSLPKVTTNEPATTTSTTSQSESKLSLTHVVGVLKSPLLFFKATDKSHTISMNNTVCSWACDGKNLYYAGFDQQLIKIGIPNQPNETLYIKEQAEVSGVDSNFAICYHDNRLLVRCSGDNPIKVYDCETLQEDSKQTEAIAIPKKEDETNIHFQDKPDQAGRQLSASPMFTDGNFIYLVSQKKYIAPADADEDHQALPTALVVEQYSPSDFKHIRSVILYKNEQQDYFVNKKLQDASDYFEKFALKSTWHTDGEHLLVCHMNKHHLFSMTTGVRLLKEDKQPGSEYNTVEVHDYINSRFFMITDSQDYQDIVDFKLDQAIKTSRNFNQAQTVTSHESLIDQVKTQYFNNDSQKQTQNLFQKLMSETAQEARQRTPLPSNSFQLASALLLDHIQANCAVFDNNLRKIESEDKARQDNYLQVFRFKGATYLTANLFRCLAQLLQEHSFLISSEKKQASLAEQLSYLNLLQILSSNLRALSYCGIQLPEIMSNQSYQAFLNAYNTNIVQLIEKGNKQNFEGQEGSLIWTQIYRVCQTVMTDSMQLICSDTAQIVTNLAEVLSQPQISDKQAENCSFSLQYLTSTQNINKLLRVDQPQQRQNLTKLLQALYEQKTVKSVNTVKLCSVLQKQPSEIQPNLFESASEYFLEQLSVQLLSYTETLNQQLQKKVVSKSEEAKQKRIEEEERFKFALSLLSKVFGLITNKLCSEVAVVVEHITSTLQKLTKEDINEEFSKQFQLYSNKIFNLVIAPQQIKTLSIYIQGLPILCAEQISLSSTVMKNSIQLVQTLSNLSSVLKDNARTLSGQKDPEDSEEEEEFEDKSKLGKMLHQLVRKVTWIVGYVSFGLIQVKTVEPTVEESKKETQQQKMERMLMDSQLLQGGLENTFINSFSVETKQKITEILLLSQDNSLSELITRSNSTTVGEDRIFGEVMTQGKNEICDLLIKVLQYCFEMQVPVVSYAKQGGEAGLRLTRAAFAVMAKYSQMGSKLENMVNEIDIIETELDSSLDEKGKLRELREKLKNEPDFKELLKQFNHAGRMRLWIAEKKKNLSEKIEKSCRETYIKQLNEQKQQKKTSQPETNEQPAQVQVAENPEIKVASEVEVQIDTMAQELDQATEKKSEEEPKPEENQEDDEVKLTPEDKEKLQQIVDVQFEKDLNAIFDKIIEKAEYLLKMQVPTAYLQLSKEQSLVRMISAPIQLAEEQELVSKLDWKERLKHWKNMRQDQGSIKSDAKLKNEIFDSGSMSVLAYLQSPINVEKIQQRVESEFLKASRRVAGLKLLAQLIELPVNEQVTCDLTNWLTSALRGKTNKLTHYLSNITGCGNHLEGQAREYFFSIIRSIIEKIKASKSKQHIIRLLDALRWQFWGRDHGSLIDLQIFKVLRVGDGDRKHPIRYAWGHAFSKETAAPDEEPSDLTKEILITFENLYFNLVSRIIDSDIGTSMQLKTTGTAIPGLERSKSLISVGKTENLIGSAFDILFKELDRFDQIFKKCPGVDYFTFVRYTNKLKSYTSQGKDVEDLTKKFTEELLLDIHFEDQEYKKEKEKKKETKDADEEVKEPAEEQQQDDTENKNKSDAEDEAQITNEEEKEPPTTEQAEKEPEKSAFDVEEEAQEEAEQEEKPEDDTKSDNNKQAETEEREQKLAEANDFSKEQSQKLAEAQFQLISRLYSSDYLTRMLRMIEVFTQVAQTQAHPMAMVQRVANPYVLTTLINLFVCAQPRNQLIVLKIIQGLIHISIPSEIFETAFLMIAKDEKLKHIADSQSQIKFSSKFIDFWFKVLLDIRSAMWDSTKLKNDDSYEVSQEIAQLINSILKVSQNQYLKWCEDIKVTTTQALLGAENLTQAERDALFCLQIGSDFQRISIGSQVVTAQNQLLTVLGYADKNQEGPLVIESNYKSEKQELLGLYYDDVSKERQEIIRVMPYNLKSVYGLSKQDVLHLANQSALLQPDVLKHMVHLLVAEKTKDDLRLQILKSITSLFTTLQKPFLQLLEQTELLSPIIRFLLESQTVDKKTSNAIIPITWLEAKATNIRVAALENDVSLNAESSLTAQILNNKQIIVTSNDTKQNLKFAQSVFLTSAINLHLLEQGQQYQCVLKPDQTDHNSANIRHGFVFIKGEELKTLDDFILKTMKSTFAVVTHDIQVRELFQEIVAKARASIEADEKHGSDWSQVFNCAVLVIAKDDFEELSTNFNNSQVQPSNDEKVSDVDFLIKQLEEWGGFKTQTILYHISQLQDKSIENIHSNLTEIINKVAEESKQNEDTLARLKQEKQPIQSEIARQEKIAAERAEKVAKAFSEGESWQLTKVKSVVEQLVEQCEGTKLDSEIAIDALLKERELNLQVMKKTIEDEFVVKKEQASEKSAKSEEAMCKLYLKELNDFKLTSIAADYLRVTSTLLRSYYKSTLLEILSSCDLSILLPSIVSSPTSSKRLACYFKSSFNQAWLTQSQTGQKTELKTVKSLIRKIISFCLNSNDVRLKDYVQRFFQDDVIGAGTKTLKTVLDAKIKSVADYFSKEDIAIEQLHPSFLVHITKVLLECRFEVFLQSESYLHVLFDTGIYQFVRFWTPSDAKSQMKVLESCLNIVFFVQEYIDVFAKTKIVSSLVNYTLLTSILIQIDYTQESFSEVQKLLLEVYLSLINLKEMAEEKLGYKLYSNLQMTLGISQARRALKIVKEKQNFQFLKYFIHESKLQDHDRQLMNQSFGTLNPHFDVKTVAKYSIDEVERIKIKAHEGCEFKQYTFLGISQSPLGENMKYYTKDQLKENDGVIDFNFSQFYTFYPVKQQLLLAMGEQKHYRLGNITVTDVPKIVPCELVPVQVATSKNSTFLLTKEKELYSVGEKWGGSHQELTKMPLPKNEVASKIFSGPRQKFVIAESGKTFFVGEPSEFELPNNSTVSAFKEFKLSNDEANTESIIEVACGNRYNLFATNKGRVWASGKQFLKRVGMDSESAVPLHFSSEAGMQVQRVWASQSKDQQLALIQVKNSSGQLSYFSVGKNEQGLLGQGGKVKETKQFGKLAFDFTKNEFTDVSLYADHAVAIDQDGLLWAWGSNIQQRAGLAEEIDFVFQPTKVVSFEQLNLQALKVSCGLDHTLVLAKSRETGRVQLYSIGKDEHNYKTLGVTQQSASESVIRPIQHFQDFDIVDFSASSKFNMVVLGGDSSPTDGLHEHKLSDGKITKGVLHAYLKENRWHFMTQAEYDKNAGKELPDVSLAFRCPVENLEEVFNGVDSIFKFDFAEIFDNESTSGHTHAISSVSEKPIQSKVAYFAQTLINGDEVHVNLSADEFLKNYTQFDVHPLVYFRLTKPLKDGAKLPTIDLQKVYKQTTKFGFRFEVTPNLTFIENKKLISQTQTEYNEYVELSKKFPVEGDSELISQMSRYLEKQSTFDIVKDEADKIFKASELSFKPDGKLHKVSESLIKQRIQLYWHFNRSFVQAFPYLLNTPPKGFKGQKIVNSSAANLFQEVKQMVLTSVKMKFVDNAIQNLDSFGDDRHSVTISRNDALRFSETGKVDHSGEHTVFGQIFQSLRTSSVKFDPWKQNSVDAQALSVEFDGESSIDAGGPYRETLTNMAVEIEKDVLPLMIKSPNNRNNHGDNRDCFVVNQNSKTPTHEEMFKFLGVLIGYAFRSKSCMPFNYAPVFWKQLVGEELTEADLKSFDTYSWQIIQDLRKHAKTIKGKEEFEQIVDQQFTTTLNCSQEIELCEEGRQKQVNQSNVEEFIRLMINARFAEGQQQIKWIQEGMAIIVPKSIVNILSWEEVEIRAAGTKTTDVEKLKSITEYRNCTENSKVVKMFWNVMSRMSEEDKTLYLKFVWGRQRLPQDCSSLRYKHRIALIEYWDKEALPESHTCFFAVDIPDYQSEEVLEKKLLTSIRFCGEIDND